MHPQLLTTKTTRAGTYWNKYDIVGPQPIDVITNRQNGDMISFGNWGYPRFPEDSDIGSGWIQRKTEMSSYGQSVGTVHGGSTAYTQHSYTGSVYGPDLGSAHNPGNSTYPIQVGMDGSGWGVDAYSRMKPTKPSFNALNAIYELREVPEMLKQKFYKSKCFGLSNYYLALKFGWEPLLTDILNLVNTQMTMQKRLSWLLRHNGQTVRRRVDLASLDHTDIYTSADYNSTRPGFVDYFYSGPRPRVDKWSYKDTVWATAAFKYFLPEGPRDIVWTTAMKARLFGLMPTPAVVWRALPWTWLSDWFANTGSLLENMDTGVANRLAAKQFYIMREVSWNQEVTLSGRLFSDPGNEIVPYSVSSDYRSSLKTRMKGDPFGWGTRPGDLSATQLAILGALGASRLR